MSTPARCELCDHLASDAARVDEASERIWFVCSFNPKRTRFLNDENVKDGPPPLFCPLRKGERHAHRNS